MSKPDQMPEKNRLWTVTFKSYFSISHIEAPDMNSAIAEALANFSSLKKEDITDVKSMPIYTEEIGLSAYSNECKDNPMPESGVFKLSIAGTDPKLLAKLKRAIARAIGGVPVGMVYNVDDDQNVSELIKLGTDIELCVESL